MIMMCSDGPWNRYARRSRRRSASTSMRAPCGAARRNPPSSGPEGVRQVVVGRVVGVGLGPGAQGDEVRGHAEAQRPPAPLPQVVVVEQGATLGELHGEVGAPVEQAQVIALRHGAALLEARAGL